MSLQVTMYWQDCLWLVSVAAVSVAPYRLRCEVDSIDGCWRLEDDFKLRDEDVEQLLVTHGERAFNERVQRQLGTVIRWHTDNTKRRKDRDDGALRDPQPR